MKALILCGGKGTRMGPSSTVVNKHLQNVYMYPMVLYTLLNALECGISDIVIVENTSRQVSQLLGNGSDFTVNGDSARITYVVQSDASGICSAMKCARDVIGDSRFICLLGDNFYLPMPVDAVCRWSSSTSHAMLFTTVVDNPCMYGVLTHDSRYNRSFIVEKPCSYVGNNIVVGMYLYSPIVWDYIGYVEPSARGEYEITTLNNMLLELGSTEICDISSAIFVDCGTYDSQLNAALLVKLLRPYVMRLVERHTLSGSIWRYV